MNDLTVATGTTSMQIAETTGKQHCHIMRDIRDEIAKLGLGGINVESLFELVEYTDAKGEKRPCYQLSKEGVLQLAARYDAVVRAKLIELAMRQKKPFKKKISNEVIPMKKPIATEETPTSEAMPTSA